MVRLAIPLAALLALGLISAGVAGTHRPSTASEGCNPDTATGDTTQSPPPQPGFVVDHAPEFVIDALETIPLPDPVRSLLDRASRPCGR